MPVSSITDLPPSSHGSPCTTIHVHLAQIRRDELLDSALVGADGAVHYRVSTTQGFFRRKVTTMLAASGVVGVINWREKLFIIDDVERTWDE